MKDSDIDYFAREHGIKIGPKIKLKEVISHLANYVDQVNETWLFNILIHDNST